MTTRERMEARAERRREWAAGRERKSAQAFEAARRIADNIPLGQPILVGHHSERGARRDQRRIQSGMDRGIESQKMAAHHTSKAGGIEDALARSIFSDDPDAIEALEAKAARLDAEADAMVTVNKAFRKAPGDGPAAKLAALVHSGTMTQASAMHCAKTFSLCSWIKQPFPAYELTNLRANARRLRERIKEVERRQEDDAATEEAGGLLITRGDTYCSVRFSEKPAREVLEALRAAFFNYSGGAWSGPLDRLPECVKALEGVTP